MITGIVKAVCVSQKKGTEKQNVDRVHVTGSWGTPMRETGTGR